MQRKEIGASDFFFFFESRSMNIFFKNECKFHNYISHLKIKFQFQFNPLYISSVEGVTILDLRSLIEGLVSYIS